MPASVDSAYLYQQKAPIIDSDTRKPHGTTELIVFHDDRFLKHGRPEYLTFTITSLYHDNSGSAIWTQLPLEYARRFADNLGEKLDKVESWNASDPETTYPMSSNDPRYIFEYVARKLDDEEHREYATDEMHVFHDTRFMYFGQPEYITITNSAKSDVASATYGMIQLPLEEACTLYTILAKALNDLPS